MKNGTFKIKRPDGVFDVEGVLTASFGIHKYQFDSDSWYAVTHRATGKLLTSFTKMKQAKAFATNAEINSPLPWSHLPEGEMADANYLWAADLARKARAGEVEEIQQEEKPLTLF